MFPSSCAYNMGFVLQFDGDDVEQEDLHLAVRRVVQSHPSLLVHVSKDGTTQVQPTVSEWKEVLAQATEIRHLPDLPEDFASEVTVDHPAVVAACSEAFDITSSAPLRFYRAGSRALLLVVHHVVCDASSLSLLGMAVQDDPPARCKMIVFLDFCWETEFQVYDVFECHLCLYASRNNFVPRTHWSDPLVSIAVEIMCLHSLGRTYLASMQSLDSLHTLPHKRGSPPQTRLRNWTIGKSFSPEREPLVQVLAAVSASNL